MVNLSIPVMIDSATPNAAQLKGDLLSPLDLQQNEILKT